MIAVGLILLAAAAAATSILIVQNPHSVVVVHVLGRVWTGHLYWVMVAGVVITAVGALGLAAIGKAGLRMRNARRERNLFAAENERIADARDRAYRSIRRRRAARDLAGGTTGQAGESGQAPG